MSTAQDGITTADVRAGITPEMAMRYDAAKKSVGATLALAFFLGPLGAHRFYLGRNGTAVIMIVLSLTVAGLIVTYPWVIIDMFRSGSMVRDYNNSIIDRLKAGNFVVGAR